MLTYLKKRLWQFLKWITNSVEDLPESEFECQDLKMRIRIVRLPAHAFQRVTYLYIQNNKIRLCKLT